MSKKFSVDPYKVINLGQGSNPLCLHCKPEF